jgi:cyclophilin family peptidyl-prolyl cis-trans isomerase
MRAWKGSVRGVVVWSLVLLAISFAAGCGATEEESSGSAENAGAPAGEAAATDDQAGDKGQEAQEETDTVTAMLTRMTTEGAEGKGATEQVEVAYLPPGKKIATLETTKGVVKIELWEDKAPNTVVNFVSLANGGRYDGVEFHRVIDGFMAQTGDVEHTGGYGGPGYTIPAEFDASLKHVRGVVSMARSNDPNSAGSQFFIMLATASHLDGQYAAFGKVVEGMDVVDTIKKGEKARNGTVDDPDKMLNVRVEVVADE